MSSLFTIMMVFAFYKLRVDMPHAPSPELSHKNFTINSDNDKLRLYNCFPFSYTGCYLKRLNSITFCFGGKNNASHLCGKRLITIPSVTYWHQYHYHICIFNFWLTRQRPWPHYLMKDQHLILYLYVS